MREKQLHAIITVNGAGKIIILPMNIVCRIVLTLPEDAWSTICFKHHKNQCDKQQWCFVQK